LSLIVTPTSSETDARNEIEIKTVVKELTITSIPNEDNSLIVVDGYFDSVSKVAPDSNRAEGIDEYLSNW